MLLLRTERLPEGPGWLYELKLDGYRAQAIKTGSKVKLRSRNDKDFSSRYPSLVEALASMPDETVLDGEVVALDEEGRPSFNALQSRGLGEPLHFFIFDVLVLRGRDVMTEPLVKRRALIEQHVLPKLYTVGGRHFDALIFGYWDGDKLMYAARTRSGFTPAVREHLHQRFRGLETAACPFANLPEARAG